MHREILIISNYFPPEKGAAPNRIFSLAEGLQNNDYEVTVVCPLPNYPTGKIFEEFKGKWSSKTQLNGINIIRLWLFASNSRNKFIRLFSMLSFAFSLSLFMLFSKTPKKVIIQCSPLFVGFAGVLCSKITGKKVVLNISDIWPLAGYQMGLLGKGMYYDILEKIERFNYKNSDLILGQSQEILNHVEDAFPQKPTFLYRNFPNFELDRSEINTQEQPIKLVYAGLLGIAQGIYNICDRISLPSNVEFHIYGNGPEADLVTKVAKEKANIHYHGMIDRSDLHKELKKYQVTLIPLVNRIYGSVPSKIFEYARLGLPILYFSEGEGSNLVSELGLGWSIEDNDFKALNTFVDQLGTGMIQLPSRTAILNTVEQEFNFEKQFDLLLGKLEQV